MKFFCLDFQNTGDWGSLGDWPAYLTGGTYWAVSQSFLMMTWGSAEKIRQPIVATFEITKSERRRSFQEQIYLSGFSRCWVGSFVLECGSLMLLVSFLDVVGSTWSTYFRKQYVSLQLKGIWSQWHADDRKESRQKNPREPLKNFLRAS